MLGLIFYECYHLLAIGGQVFGVAEPTGYIMFYGETQEAYLEVMRIGGYGFGESFLASVEVFKLGIGVPGITGFKRFQRTEVADGDRRLVGAFAQLILQRIG